MKKKILSTREERERKQSKDREVTLELLECPMCGYKPKYWVFFWDSGIIFKKLRYDCEECKAEFEAKISRYEYWKRTR